MCARGGFTQEAIRRMYGDQERRIDFKVPVPVHHSYQTAFVDDGGQLRFRDDIYGIDREVTAQLRGDARRMADAVMERPANPNYQIQPEDRRWLDNVASRNTAPAHPFALFEQLFR